MASGVPFGAYRLVRRLGAGGMAEVFLARREGPGGFAKQLVIKRILPHLARNEGFVQMFLREAKVAALIDHPNLVHVSDFGEIDGEYYLAMELVDGFTLTEVVRRVATFTPGVAVRIAVDLLEALNAVHAARGADGEHIGLVHRDVSPGNVMLTREGAVKLLDLGIAISKDDDTSTLMGTRRFMSPEALAGAAQDARSDLFSVGVLLYAMITARHPFPDLPKEVPQRPDEIPEDLWPTVRAALHPDPDERPSSARAMLAPLELFLSSRGIEGTRSHLATVLQAVLPPAGSPAARMVSRLTQQLGHLTRVVTGTAGSEVEPGPTRALPAPRSGGLRPLAVALGLFALFAGGGVAVLSKAKAPVTVEPLPMTPEALAAARARAGLAAPEAESDREVREPAPAPPSEPETTHEPEPAERSRARSEPRAKPSRTKRRAARAKAPVPATGRLTIDTRPWTEVFLGGRRLGMTPLQGVELPTGRHRLRLENKQAGLETTLTVRIRPGRETRIRRAL